MNLLAFQYQALDRSGSRSKGVVQATNREDAYRQLAAAGLRPLRITARGIKQRSGRKKKVTLKDLSHLTYQLSVLMHARIGIVDGLRSIVDQEPNVRLRQIVDDVATRIESGMNVTEAMSPYREIFGDVYLETIRAAELSGNMVQVLEQLADMLDKRYETGKAVKGALMYPACVIGVLVLAVSVLLIFVVPTFAQMFEARDIVLPLPTRILVGLSAIIRAYWYLILGGLFGLAWTVRQAWSRPKSRERIDGWLHRV
ncbi:MAG: type II secretion system F family protein, partial [Planctomycetota bacterium]